MTVQELISKLEKYNSKDKVMLQIESVFSDVRDVTNERYTVYIKSEE